MKNKILPGVFVVLCCLIIFIPVTLAQPHIKFSELSSFTKKPIILGQTPDNFFCLYPDDSAAQLVIYNPELIEQTRLNWLSIVTPKPGEAYQPFTLNNHLVILTHKKNESIINISCTIVDEKGKIVSEKNLITDYTYKGQLIQPYAVEVSKNGKYILFYRAIKLDEETIMLKGYLFDNTWNNLKEFSIPIDKNETGDSWDGAYVDIEGNIHTLVYTIADSWKLGSRIAIYSIAKDSGEAQSEKIEVLKKRLFNYSISEDTLAHVIRLQAIAAWQHQKDALEGLAFISIPYSRTRKIEYASYQFSSDQKKQLAKNVTAEKKLISNSIIDFPSSFASGGSFFTAINIHGDYLEENNQMPNPKKISKSTDEHFVYRPPNVQNDKNSKLADGHPAFPFTTDQRLRPNNFQAVTENLAFFRNNQKGMLQSSVMHVVKKNVLPFYDDGLFAIVKNNSLQLLGYLMTINGPSLTLLTENKDGIIRVEAPGYNFIQFSHPTRIDDNSSLFPYVNIKSNQYGLARVSF